MRTATYEQLLNETLPHVIETDEQYQRIGGRFGELVGKGRSRTPDETKLMRLLALLIEDYDRRNSLPPDDSTPAEKLQFLRTTFSSYRNVRSRTSRSSPAGGLIPRSVRGRRCRA